MSVLRDTNKKLIFLTLIIKMFGFSALFHNVPRQVQRVDDPFVVVPVVRDVYDDFVHLSDEEASEDDYVYVSDEEIDIVII
jgi:hypothetical protein